VTSPPRRTYQTPLIRPDRREDEGAIRQSTARPGIMTADLELPGSRRTVAARSSAAALRGRLILPRGVTPRPVGRYHARAAVRRPAGGYRGVRAQRRVSARVRAV
jgi:hypothetical protein